MTNDWSSGLDLFADLNRNDGIRQSIERCLRTAIRDGRLGPGATVPAARSLAHDLGVARGTVTAAYSQLAAEGYLSIRQGAATRVSWAPPRRPAPPTSPPVTARPRWDLRPGRPSGAGFPRTAWARAYRHALAHAPDEVFGYGDVRGHIELRSAVADYLGRARGVYTAADQILICSGFTQALSLICQTLRMREATILAVENPSTYRYRDLAAACGLTVVPVPCDGDGLRTDRLTQSGADAVLVTPAHQYPLGITMSPARRACLVEWAQHHNGLIIEDDYDGEFRYDRQPVGALQQMDPGRVIYTGTTSKTLAPALRLGWLTAPPFLQEALISTKERLDRGAAVLDQLALANLITSSAFDRHIRRMRTTYRRRRDELARALTDHVPDVHITGIAAGLHALIQLPEGTSEQELARAATRHGIAFQTLTDYWHGPPEIHPQSIIVGYATPADHAYRPALTALTHLLGAASGCTPGRRPGPVATFTSSELCGGIVSMGHVAPSRSAQVPREAFTGGGLDAVEAVGVRVDDSERFIGMGRRPYRASGEDLRVQQPDPRRDCGDALGRQVTTASRSLRGLALSGRENAEQFEEALAGGRSDIVGQCGEGNGHRRHSRLVQYRRDEDMAIEDLDVRVLRRGGSGHPRQVGRDVRGRPAAATGQCGPIVAGDLEFDEFHGRGANPPKVRLARRSHQEGSFWICQGSRTGICGIRASVPRSTSRRSRGEPTRLR